MADPRVRELAKRADEWFLRRQALAAARAQVPRRDQLAGRAFNQVRLLREITRQVGETAEEPPCGHRAAVLLGLYRELIYWALVAGERGEPGGNRGPRGALAAGAPRPAARGGGERRESRGRSRRAGDVPDGLARRDG